MSIPTDVVLENSFQVLDPLDIAPPGTNLEAYVEEAVTQLTQGQQVHSIVFAVQKASLNYHFDEEQMRNTTDAAPRVFSWLITNKSVDGFEVTLSGTPDTGNYYFSWKVRIPTALTNNVIITAESAGSGGTVTRVDATGASGITAVVTNATTAPTIAIDVANGGLPLAKLAQSVVVDDGTVTKNSAAQTLTNKGIDGNNNTLTNIGLASLAGSGIIAKNLADPGADRLFRWNESINDVDFMAPTDVLTFLSSEVVLRTAGGVSVPYKAAANTDAARGTALSNAFSAAVAGDTIEIGSGTFEVGAFLTIPSGVTAHGNNSTIKAGDFGNPGQACIIQSSGSGNEGIVVDNITFDCNLAGQSASGASIGAVSLFGSNCRITNCTAINWGTKHATVENFIFIIGLKSTGSISFNNKILYCTVYQPATGVTHGAGGTTAFDIWGSGVGLLVGNAWQVNLEIAHCSAHDIYQNAAGTDAPVAFHMITPGASYGGSIHDNYAYNLLSEQGGVGSIAAIYQDTFSSIGMSVYNNVFTKTAMAVFLSPGSYQFHEWTITGNYFTTVTLKNGVAQFPNQPSWGVRILGSTGDHVTGFRITDNTMKLGDTSQNANTFGVALDYCDDFLILDSTIDCVTPVSATNSTAITQYGLFDSTGSVVGTPPNVLATGASHTVDEVITALQGIGLFRQS